MAEQVLKEVSTDKVVGLKCDKLIIEQLEEMLLLAKQNKLSNLCTAYFEENEGRYYHYTNNFKDSADYWKLIGILDEMKYNIHKYWND